MVKKPKRGKKETAQKSISQTSSRSSGQISIEKALIENFVSFQRVMVNLSGKLDNLANQISKLLELFEISAKALAEKNFQVGDEKGNKKIMERLDTLLDQNKIIARGLTLMHELNSKQEAPSEYPAQQIPRQETGVAGYQKSLASGESAEFESSIPIGAKKFKKLP
jgi:hypothetical protein